MGVTKGGSSPLTISPFQTAGRCVSILLSMIGYSVHLKRGECLHIELRYRASQISRGLLGSTPSGRLMRGRCWVLVSATVDHAARLPFCTKDSLSLFTHPSCEVGTWLGSSMGVTSALFKWGNFENTC